MKIAATGICLCGLITAITADMGIASEQQCTASILVNNTYGENIPRFNLEIFDAQNKRVAAIQKTRDTVSLPYGTYTFAGKASLYDSYRRVVKLESPKALIVVSFSPQHYGHFEVEFTPIQGRLNPAPEQTEGFWVRVVSLRGQLIRDVRVETGGGFVLDGLPHGDYLLLVFKDGAMLTQDVLRKNPMVTTVSITLPGRSSDKGVQPK